MMPGKLYVVTKGSADGTLLEGDHIALTPTGGLVCWEAKGWINKGAVAEALVGVEYEIDKEWKQAYKKILTEALASLDAED